MRVARGLRCAGTMKRLLLASLVLSASCYAVVGDDTGDPNAIPAIADQLSCDVLVVGGGLGGVAAAHEAASSGRRTCLTEETDWLGGQLSTEGTPVDQLYTQTARSYDQIFAEVLDWYRARYSGAPTGPFNPGACFRFTCAEPRAYADVIEHTFLAIPNLTIIKRAHPTTVILDGTTVRGVELTRDGLPNLRITAAVTIDATELGDLLPLAHAAYRTGREPASDTGEPSAINDGGDRECTQRLTYTFALERRPPGENHRIAKPPGYDATKYGGAGLHLDIFAPSDPNCTGNCNSWWTWRRYLSPINLPGAADITSVNYFGANDFALQESWCGPDGCNLIDKTPEARARILQAAKNHALGYLYFLQNDTVPAYPYLELRPDVMGSTDGLSVIPYIRESRRLRAITTIREQDVGLRDGTGLGARFDDTLGIGVYGTDIKACALPHKDDDVPWGPARYVQIPLGALIPEAVDGLIAGGKDLGTTHISNGVYRVHPNEYNVGLAAGATAALAVEAGVTPRALRANAALLRKLQFRIASRRGGPLVHFSDVAMTDAAFTAIQLTAASGVMAGYDDRTFHPTASITRAQAAIVTTRALGIAPVTECRPIFTDVPCTYFAYGPIMALVDRGAISGYADGTFRPGNAVTRAQMSKIFITSLCAVTPSRCQGTPPNPGFTDVATTDWFYPFVARGAQLGLFVGDASGTFNPGGELARRSAAIWVFDEMRGRLGF